MIDLYGIDAFTAAPFRGNPAAVCLLPAGSEQAPDAWLQHVAAEMNLSETAFLSREGEHEYRLRWFTPQVEVDLCGHATLASAHYLWSSGHASPEAVLRFNTRSGLLTATRLPDGWIQLDFPISEIRRIDPPQGLAAAVSGLPVRSVWTDGNDLLAELGSETELTGMKPDIAAIAALGYRGLLVTARSDDDAYDFASRCFFPGMGIDEDPVTGSAHCTLAPFWQRQLGKSAFTAVQRSAREGVLRLELEGSRIRIAGQAVTVWKGGLAQGPTAD